MVRGFVYARTKKNQETVAKNVPKERPEQLGAKQNFTRRDRFKKPTEALKEIDIGLLAKMEELRLLPTSHTHDEIGSYFYDELEFLNALDASSFFKSRIYHPLIDISQSLPLILLNKEKIMETLLDAYDDKYFMPLTAKLLVALIRDCGREIYQLYLMRVLPTILAPVNPTAIPEIQHAFKIIASSLRFLIKPIMEDPSAFVRILLAQLLPHNNVYLRKFTAESCVYVVGRIRDVTLLSRTVVEVLNLDAPHKEDFDAHFLSLTLRGERGSISLAARDIISTVAELMSSTQRSVSWFKTVFNLVIENEYKFFKARKDNEANPDASKELGNPVYLEDYLNSIYETNPNCEVLCQNILSLLNEILLFGSGQRFTDKLMNLGEIILKKASKSYKLIDDALVFIAKLISVKKQTVPILNTLLVLNLTSEQIYLFLENLFRRSTFDRTQIFKRKKSNRKVDLSGPLSTPNLELSDAMMEFLINSVAALAGDSEDTSCQSLFYISQILRKNLPEGVVVKLEAKIFKTLKKISMSSQVSTLERLAAANLISRCENLTEDNSVQEIITWLCSHSPTLGLPQNSDADMNYDEIYNSEYLKQYDILTKNYSVDTVAESDLLIWCQLGMVVLVNITKLTTNNLKSLTSKAVELLKIKDNYTCVVEFWNQLKKVSIILSKKNKQPVTDLVRTNDEGSVEFVISEQKDRERLFKYLWSDVPEARMQAVRLLLNPNSELQRELLTIDNTGILFENERSLYLNASQLATNCYYSKYTEFEEEVLFHYLQGAISCRLSTMQGPLAATQAILLRKHHNLSKYFYRRLLISNVDLQYTEVEEPFGASAEESLQWLLRPRADPVGDGIKRMRVFDWVESALGYSGQSWESLLKGKSTRGNRNVKQEQRENVGTNEGDDFAAEDTNAVYKNESKERLAAVYKIFEALLIHEVMPTALPSISTVLKITPFSVQKLPDLEVIINSCRQTTEKALFDSRSQQAKISALERMKRLMKGLKACPYLYTLDSRELLSKYLIEILKYPSEELQVLTLSTYFRLEKQNKILRQHMRILTNLTGQDSFKDHLMKLSEKLGELTTMERENIMPVVNAILYRRLIDRTGIANNKRFKSQRDFILDIASSYSGSDITLMLESIYMSSGLTRTSTGKLTPFGGANSGIVNLTRLVALADLGDNIISKVANVQVIQDFLMLWVDVAETSTQAVDKLSTTVDLLLEKMGKHPAKSKLLQEIQAEEPAEDEDQPDAQEDEVPAAVAMQEEELEPSKDVEDQAELGDVEEIAGLSTEDRALLAVYKQFKTLKQEALKRIIQIQASYLHIDYSDCNRRIVKIYKSSFDRLATKPQARVSLPIKILGLWAECEIYKVNFLEFPALFTAMIGLIRNKGVIAPIYGEMFDNLVKLAQFGLTEENMDEFNVGVLCKRYIGAPDAFSERRSVVDGQLQKYSCIGDKLINSHINELIDSLASFTVDLEKKKLENIRASDNKNLNKKLSEFVLFISDYCTEGESSLRFYEVTKRSWSVDSINKKTAKPHFMIHDAQELIVVQKEHVIASNMLKILGNFAAKVPAIEEIFCDFILPMASRLEDLKLRIILEEILNKLATNKEFHKLGIRQEFLQKIAALNRLAPGMMKVMLNFNYVVDFIIKTHQILNTLTENEMRLTVACCVFWLSTEELSAREKSLDLLHDYLKMQFTSVQILQDQIYKKTVLDSITYYLSSHFGREHVMRYYSLLLRYHVIESTSRLGASVEGIPYADLMHLINLEDADKDFFLLIFNVKVGIRGAAIKLMKKVLLKRNFEYWTVKKILTKIFEFYLYEYWKMVNNPKSGFSTERIDQVRQMLQGVFDTYGRIVSGLNFTAFVKTLKDKIFQLDGKNEDYTETSVKIICSCLDHLKSNLPNILETLKEEQDQLNQKLLKSSSLNKFMEIYNDQTAIFKARNDFDLKKINDPNTIQNELDEYKQENEASEVMDGVEQSDEDSEQIEKELMSDNHYRTLKLHVLNPLKKQLLKKDAKEQNKFSVRSEVAMGILQLIKLFPFNVFNTELVGMVNRICGILVDRDEDRRKTARNTLVNLIKILGPYFFGFFVKEMAYHLKRGYEVHIRNYMIYKLLETLVQGEPTTPGSKKDSDHETIKCGQLDYSVPIVAPLLLQEICGELEEEKEVQEIKFKIMEFRRNKGLESFRLICQKIDFNSEALKQMVDCFEHQFLKTSSLSKVLGKMNELSVNLIAGLVVNPTLKTEPILLFCSALNQSASAYLKDKLKQVAEVDIRPGMDLEHVDSRSKMREEVFKIQEGAAQGKSICKRFIDRSQAEVRTEARSS
jgi:hypothetical protein